MKGVLHRPEKSDILNPESISNFLGKGENGMEHLYEKALESAEYIKTHTKKRPKIAVVLGSAGASSGMLIVTLDRKTSFASAMVARLKSSAAVYIVSSYFVIKHGLLQKAKSYA